MDKTETFVYLCFEIPVGRRWSQYLSDVMISFAFFPFLFTLKYSIQFFVCCGLCVCVCVPVSVLFFGFTFFLFFFSLSRVAFDVPFLSRSGERRSLSDMIVRLSSERQQVDQSGLLSFRSDFGGTSTAFQQQHKREPHHLTNPTDFLFFLSPCKWFRVEFIFYVIHSF